jgi:choline kinase
MHVILLAAGRAQRLRPLTDHTPKCLLDVGPATILSRALRILSEHGLRRFTIVDGFEGETLRRAVLAEFPAAWFTFVRNEVWETTNNSHSLWLARYPDADPMLLLDSDIVFEPGVVARMLEEGAPNRLALRSKGGVGEEEIKVIVGPDGRITDIGKTMPPHLALGESVGIEVFSADFTARLWQTLERRARDEGGANEWYEASFLELIRQGEVIHPVDLGDLACMEIDTVEDLARARQVFAGA